MVQNADISSSEVFPAGYSVYRQDRADGYGGLFIACRESLISCKMEINNYKMVACEIKLLDNSKLIACSIYRPPSSNDDYLANLCEYLESIRASHPNSALWIAGDVNLPDINWQDNCVEGHQYSSNINNFLNNNGLSQIIECTI